MRHLQLPSGMLLALTDVAPSPVDWRLAFPDADAAAHPDDVAAWLPDGLFHTRFAIHALIREGRIMLVDAGLGPGPSAYFNGLSGTLPATMQAAGLDPANVDLVLFTHFHLDHVGWAMGADGEPFFPHARYLAPRAEIAHWQSHASEAALPHHVEAWQRTIRPLAERGLLDAMEAGTPVDTGHWSDVRYMAAPGHTAGHSAVAIAGREPVLIAGDSWHSPVQIAVPSFRHRADRDKVMAQASHRQLVQWAHEQQAIVCSGHFPEDLAFGRVSLDERGQATFAPVKTGAA